MVFLLYNCNVLAKDNQVTFSVGSAPPYIIFNDPNVDTNTKEKISGLAIDIVRSAYKQKGISVTFLQDDWSTTTNKIDGEPIMSLWWQKDKQRQKKWYFSQPIYKKEFVFLARRDVRFYWQRFDQLRQYKLGISRYQSYGEEFDNYVQYLKVHYVNSAFNGISKLLKNDIDALLIEKSEAQYLLSFYNSEEQKKLEMKDEQVIQTEPYFIVCGKGYRNCNYLIEEFNSGLRELISSGKYAKITKNYLSSS
jgi:polar amino acid transport system substrate-binding protein